MVKTKKKVAANRSKKAVNLSENDPQAEELAVEPSNGPTFQRNRMESIKTELLNLVDHWENILRNEKVPQAVSDEILAVAGQTKLLTSNKFEQFSGLISNCEKLMSSDPSKPSGFDTVTCNDLDGFWEMMYIQVEQLKQRYENLTQLQNNNWKTIVEKVKNDKPQPRPLKSNNAVSRIKEAINAKRAAMLKSTSSDKENTKTNTISISTKDLEEVAFTESDVISSTMIKPTKSTRKKKQPVKSKSSDKTTANGDDISSSQATQEAAPLRRSSRIAAMNTAASAVSSSNKLTVINESSGSTKNAKGRRKREQEPKEITEAKKPKNFAQLNKLKAEKFRRSSFGTIGLAVSHKGKTISKPKS